MMLPVPPSSELALTEKYPPVKFSTFKDLRKIVASQYKKLSDGDENQHLSFSHVTPKQFETIEEHRVDLGRGVSFTYFGDIETLIIKLPSQVHERAHCMFGERMVRAVTAMQLGPEEFAGYGATKYVGENASSKEGDSSWKNLRVRSNKGDWPTLVIEAGMSESMPRLHTDARWWIEHSAGKVNIVLLIWIRPSIKAIKIEKWVPGAAPVTKTSSCLRSNAFPTLTEEITIDQSNTPSVIKGTPLRLEFDKIFDRPANPPVEQDVVFSSQDLDDWTRWLWVGL
ncbi:hypothetical protein VTN96DRAFT_1688 [Rasamsonia emersonii]